MCRLDDAGWRIEVPLITMTNAPLPSGGFAATLHAKDALPPAGILKGGWRVEEIKAKPFEMME